MILHILLFYDIPNKLQYDLYNKEVGMNVLAYKLTLLGLKVAIDPIELKLWWK